MAELKNAELEIFSLFEMTPDLVCIASKDGFFKKINPAVINKLGYTKEELYSRPIFSFMHPDDREMTARERAKLLQGKAMLNFQNRYITKAGEIVWLEWTSIYLPDKELVLAIAKDVTKTKQAEKKIEEKYYKFKSLATHFKASMENSRKFLATELHEELAQLAVVLKMDIDYIKNAEPSLSQQVQKRLDHAMAVSNVLINAIRRISFSISPGMLNDVGLSATLEWQCKEFSILNGIPCSFKAAYNETHLTQEMKLDFFRVCQEALINIMDHAEAKNVSICIEETGNEICLSIIDDGKGFDSKEKDKIFGLTTMQKRIASINGEIAIASTPGRGTKISVSVAKQTIN
jgi:PAS domain S-box-containing protein